MLSADPPAIQPSRWLLWVAGSNGWSIALASGSLTLISLLFAPDPIGLLTGGLVTLFASFEILGWQRLRHADSSGFRWARRSQIGVFLTLAAYCLFQLATVDAASLQSLLSPRMTAFLLNLYQIDEWTLGALLLTLARLTYASVLLASAVYQGGMWWYYQRQEARLKAGAGLVSKALS